MLGCDTQAGREADHLRALGEQGVALVADGQELVVRHPGEAVAGPFVVNDDEVAPLAVAVAQDALFHQLANHAVDAGLRAQAKRDDELVIGRRDAVDRQPADRLNEIALTRRHLSRHPVQSLDGLKINSHPLFKGVPGTQGAEAVVRGQVFGFAGGAGVGHGSTARAGQGLGFWGGDGYITHLGRRIDYHRMRSLRSFL